MAVAAMAAVEEAVVSMEAAVEAVFMVAEAGATRILVAVVAVPRDVQAERLRAHFQDRAPMGIAATHMDRGRMA
jgi:hypothetical protein